MWVEGARRARERGGLLERLRVQVDRGDPGPALERLEGDRAAHAAAGAGDHDDLVCDLHRYLLDRRPGRRASRIRRTPLRRSTPEPVGVERPAVRRPARRVRWRARGRGRSGRCACRSGSARTVASAGPGAAARRVVGLTGSASGVLERSGELCSGATGCARSSAWRAGGSGSVSGTSIGVGASWGSASVRRTTGRAFLMAERTTGRAMFAIDCGRLERHGRMTCRAPPQPEAPARTPAADGDAQPARDPRGRRPAGHRRGPGPALDRRPRRPHRHEQERPVRPLPVEGGAPARDDRRGRGHLRRGRSSARCTSPSPASRPSSRSPTRSSTTSAGRVFPGGCFFACASAELQSRPGPVKERIAAFDRAGTAAVEAASRPPRRAGDLPATRTSTRCSSSSTRTCCTRTRPSRSAATRRSSTARRTRSGGAWGSRRRRPSAGPPGPSVRTAARAIANRISAQASGSRPRFVDELVPRLERGQHREHLRGRRGVHVRSQPARCLQPPAEVVHARPPVAVRALDRAGRLRVHPGQDLDPGERLAVRRVHRALRRDKPRSMAVTGSGSRYAVDDRAEPRAVQHVVEQRVEQPRPGPEDRVDRRAGDARPPRSRRSRPTAPRPRGGWRGRHRGWRGEVSWAASARAVWTYLRGMPDIILDTTSCRVE